MPIVEVHVLDGYAPDAKSRLTTALTQAVRFVIPAPDDAITVLVHEHASENYARGSKSRAPAPALGDPCKIVLDFLCLMEERELAQAQTLLADGFEMVFPGNRSMTRLQDLVEWAAERYRHVTKTYDAVEAFQGDAGAVVYARGSLTGIWLDGRPFAGVRFIDRFEISNDRITRQDVWNDLGEVRPQ